MVAFGLNRANHGSNPVDMETKITRIGGTLSF